ncbi:TIGR04283 family arsenosugar biosynthesis glycosyltransferase [Luteithermobacter gelatinilyticus]|uniref:TIGR04283 family arsenosugar biosynthesis glycosyltransferase n=1 Tax=Luteithermobacter gelatinilyticus TaxID=2582913 RepID=UPI001AEFE587|nr:TIGR04283 family arsenosugar biosynthesis glycosyltransferase [Luteithermobacter gelatinilyticus]
MSWHDGLCRGMIAAMITVVIPTLNAAEDLTRLLSRLTDALVEEVIVADGGSLDETVEIARKHGARVVVTAPGRGGQMAGGAAVARGDWLLFLHADSLLVPGWQAVVRAHQQAAPDRALVFRLGFDDQSWKARFLELVVRWRCRFLALPYGDQGLLISRRLYQALGGFKDMVLMEDVDIARRLGRKRLVFSPHPLMTSARRYQTAGYGRRILRNLFCLSLYFLGVSPQRIRKIYS